MSNSYDAITWAIRARGVSAGAYRLLIALAKRVGKRGFDVWPSHKKMAHDAEMSVASVRRHIDELTAATLIARIPSSRPDGSQSSNVYRLQVRSAHDFGAAASQWVRPDDGQDDDDDDDDDRVLNMSRGGAQFVQGDLLAREQGGVLAGEHPYELESLGTESIELPLSDDEVVTMFRAGWDQYSSALAGGGKLLSFSDTRRKHLLARVKEHATSRLPADMATLFSTVFERMSGSLLLRGEKTSWRPSADWLVNKTNFNKVMEGAYVQDYGTDGRGPGPDRSILASGQEARDILHAGGGVARRSARELAGLPPRSATSAH